MPEEMTTEPDQLTWRIVATKYPEFVQWCVQTYGPFPEEACHEADYTRLREAYLNRFREDPHAQE